MAVAGVFGRADAVAISDVTGRVHTLQLTADGGFAYSGTGPTLPAAIIAYELVGSTRTISTRRTSPPPTTDGPSRSQAEEPTSVAATFATAGPASLVRLLEQVEELTWRQDRQLGCEREEMAVAGNE